MSKTSRSPGKAARKSDLSQAAPPAQQPRSPRRQLLLEVALFAVAAFVVSRFLHALSAATSTADAFYHLRHADLYASHGLFMTAFPWVSCSVISKFAGDIWYGFHLILIPFTQLPEGLLQFLFVKAPEAIIRTKVAAIFLLVVLLVTLYLAMRRSKVAYPYLWPFLFLFSSGTTIYRQAAVRPQLISIGLSVLLFSLLVSGGVWGVFFTCLALTFFHLSFFWLAILLAGVVALFKWRIEKVIEWRKLAAVPAGLLVGLLLRPNPIGAAKILYVQIIQLIIEKQQGVQLLFGRELFPLKGEELFSDYGLFLTLWLGGMLVGLILLLPHRRMLAPQQRLFLWGSSALALLFFGMTMAMSARAADQWVPFAVTSLAAIFTCAVELKRRRAEQTTRLARPLPHPALKFLPHALAVLLLFGMFLAVKPAYVDQMHYGAKQYRYKDAADWLRLNSFSGEVVFDVNWGHFPYLFYWNQQNYYIGGMDPIFQYAYSKELYWKAHHLAKSEGVEYTWGTSSTAPENPEDTFTVLRRDFRAAYLLVDGYDTPKLLDYVMQDPRFELYFQNPAARTAVFRLAQ